MVSKRVFAKFLLDGLGETLGKSVKISTASHLPSSSHVSIANSMKV